MTSYTVAGRAFELGPNAELKAELDALYPDEPWDACGPNGASLDAIGFWEGRDHHALFHMLGQDTPNWDPASFTFYKRAPTAYGRRRTDKSQYRCASSRRRMLA